MFPTIIAVVGFWVWVRRRMTTTRFMTISFALLMSILMAVCSISLLVIRVPVGLDQTVTYFVPTCYPLSQTGWHDSAANQFFYLIVLGWPNGVPLHSFGITDDQSEFMRWQRFADGLIIGAITLFAALATIVLLEAGSVYLDSKTPNKSEDRLS